MLVELAVMVRAWNAHFPQYPSCSIRYLTVSLSCSCSLPWTPAALEPLLIQPRSLMFSLDLNSFSKT